MSLLNIMSSASPVSPSVEFADLLEELVLLLEMEKLFCESSLSSSSIKSFPISSALLLMRSDWSTTSQSDVVSSREYKRM